MVGQILSQSVSVKFEKLDKSPGILPSVLDTLGAIDRIEIGNLVFSIDDPEVQYIEARRLAFQKAEQKAGELAGYAGIKLGRAVSISENSTGFMPLTSNVQMALYESRESDMAGAPSAVPGGEISVDYEITVIFETH